jgi:O-antigen/teichoic acid export membrane protein
MKLFGAASIYFGANIINAAIPFLLLPVLTRVLTPAEYGTVAIFLVMVGLFSSVTGLSVHGAVGVRFFQLSKNDFADYVSSCVGILIVSTAFTLVLLLMFQHWVVDLSGLSIDWLIIAVLISGAQFLINIRLSIWQVAGFAWRYGGLQISRSMLDASLTLVLLLVLGMAWQGRLLGMAYSIGIFALVGVYWLYKDGYLRRPSAWHDHADDAIKFGFPLIPHAIGSMLIFLTDRLIINKKLGSDAVGIYMVALQLGMAISLITDSFNKAYAPWLYEGLNKKSKILNIKIIKGTYLYFFLILAAGSSYGLVAPYLMPYFIGEEFLNSSDLIIYISIGFSFGGCYYMVANYIFFANKNAILAFVTISAGILNIPITYFMVKNFGIVGAAFAFMVVNCLVFLGTWFAASRAYKMPWFFFKD